VWRLEQGRAVLVAYRIFRGPKKTYGVIPGVLGRSEFGLEIVLTVAYLIYVMGLSFDKTCLLLSFLQQLKLSKSQADALLRQLAQHWSEEFEVLCTLLANSLVVHADETRWSLNSLWVFLSEKARLLFFGVPKDAATLKEILDPESFLGLLFSDDAAVYANFSNAQKCWAHLLRKAIKLTLQDAENTAYRAFADRLLEIDRAACQTQKDKRLSDAGRARKVDALENELFELCGPVWLEDPSQGSLDHDRRLLAVELMRLALTEQLFTFVTAQAAAQPNGACQPLDSTNNEAERTLRQPAQARETGQTSKTLAGARRTSILASVLQSLRLYLTEYTLQSVIEEVKRWQAAGRSCFRALLESLGLSLPDHSVLDRVLPQPSG
jgi:transposase